MITHTSFRTRNKQLVDKLKSTYIEDIYDYLLKNGFKRKRGYSNVLTSKDKVFKSNTVLLGRVEEIPKKYLVPTIVFKSSNGSNCILQAKASRHNLRNACNFLSEKYDDWQDGHCGNVGWFNNKPVIIDW